MCFLTWIYKVACQIIIIFCMEYQWKEKEEAGGLIAG